MVHLSKRWGRLRQINTKMIYRQIHCISENANFVIFVCLSVCHTLLSFTQNWNFVESPCLWGGWNSSEIISPVVSLGCSLSAHPNIKGLLQGEHTEILAQSDPVDLSVGDIRSHIAAEWLQIAQRSQWRAYTGNYAPSLFRIVPSLATLRPLLPPMGVPYAPKIRERPYLPIYFMFGSRV